MSTVRRLAIVFAVSACQVFASAKPQTAPVLGQIVQSSGATVDGVAALGGGTLLAGDTLATSAGGAALIRIPGGGQVELSENTTVGFSGTPGHVIAKIAQGSIVAEAPDSAFLLIEAAQCRIQPAGGASATSAISVILGGNATVTARVGSISITGIGSTEAHTLSQGETYVCPNVPAAGNAQAREESKPAAAEKAGQAGPAGPVVAPTHSNTGLIVLLVGGGAAVGIGAALAAGGHGGSSGGPASPSAP